MASAPADFPALVELFRRGDLHALRARAAPQIEAGTASADLLELAGVAAARMGALDEAISNLRAALTIDPTRAAARASLATALVEMGRLDEVAGVCGDSTDLRLLRLKAYAHQQLGEDADAIQAYRDIVRQDPVDFASWNNLGNALAAGGALDEAIAAIDRAISLRPHEIPMYLNLSGLLLQADRAEVRRRVMEEAARRAPGRAEVLVELGLARAGARDIAAAEQAFRAAIEAEPNAISAYLELAMVLENLNRLDELTALADRAEASALPRPETGFIRAWALRRSGSLQEALTLAEATPATINPIRRHQLLADLYDRTGNADAAFAHFTQMNLAAAAAKPAPPGPTYLDRVRRSASLLTEDFGRDWSGVGGTQGADSPIFIVGFPRSGTTLLDTLLMNMPQLHVLEELPVLRQVELALGDEAPLSTLSDEEAARLRSVYFDALQRISPPQPGQRVVDKFPLHMAQMPLIHRIFPDARVVLVERHPCDAVLSCFIANFQLNLAMRSFVDLTEAARVYDAVFDHWTRATSLLPISVHRVRYERMVDDLEGEMRPLLDFLGLPWDDRVLDNQASAGKRSHIRTASYSQVGEPIYRRAAYRWERYRSHLAPVLPILRPWAERMGYGIDPKVDAAPITGS